MTLIPGSEKLKKLFDKRSFNEQDTFIRATGTIMEVKRNFLRKFSSNQDERFDFVAEVFHDKIVAKNLNEAVLLIGYEKSCLESFKRNRLLGGINILDLAGVYYPKIAEMRNKYDVYKNTMPPDNVFDEICLRKQSEIELADHIIVLSGMVKEELLKGGIPEGKISVLQLGYDSEIFKPKKKYKLSEILQIIYVGAISYRKGFGELVKVAGELNGKANFTVIGPKSDAGKLLNDLPSNMHHLPYM
ncbi:MAG: hypothetical protein ABUT20_65375, partial [Bacteroidota bacterium]